MLVTEEMVETMKPGSIIIDLAVEAGGNCPLSQLGKIVVKNGVKIVGHANVPGRLSGDASRLFARNIVSFLTPMIDAETGALKIDTEDEIIAGTLVTRDGAVVHPSLAPKAAEPAVTDEEPAKTEETVDGNG